MKLSIVMAGRNDDYAGNYLRRVNPTLKVLAALAERHSVPVELVFVEWNPPRDRIPIRDVVQWPKGLPVRVITVPPEVHDLFPDTAELPFCEYVAKNVGIRRATGEIILVTNVDILLSDGIMKRIRNTPFYHDNVYRACRYDLDIGLLLPAGNGDDLLSFAEAHVETIWNCAEAAGDFLLMSREAWHDLHGCVEHPSYVHIDSYTVWVAQRNLKMCQVVFPEPIYHQWHDRLRAPKPSIDFRGDRNGDGWGLGGMELAEWRNF